MLDTTGGDSRAVATAPFVEDLLSTDRTRPRCAPNASIAALAEVAYETPAIARGIVIAPPARWNPDLKTMETIVAALRTLPLVQSATLDDLFATISNEAGARHQRPAPARARDARGDARRPDGVRDDRDELSAYRAVVGAHDPVVVDGEAALLTALSTSITPERAHAELAQIDQAVQSFSDGIRADEKRITLTSRQARGAADASRTTSNPRAT